MSDKGGYNYLSRWPVLRLLLPMMLGILLYRVCVSVVLPVALVAVSIILIVGMMLSKSTPATAMRKKRIGLLPLALLMMAVGWFAAYIAAPATLNLDKVNGKFACGRIEKIEYNDIPETFKGSAIVLVTAGLMAMAFLGFSGVI